MTTKSISTHQSTDGYWTLHNGDVSHVLPTLPANTFSGAFCDPPYGISFMERDWDKAVPTDEVWEQVLRLCKPGAYMLAFGGARTFHRLACNIEDAGWEIRDTLYWLYGEGFPKGHNISKGIARHKGMGQPTHGSCSTPKPAEVQMWNGYNTVLKPACEPIILAQKPRRGTFAANALRYGCGGLNVDGCRIQTSENDEAEQGRWPANVLLDENAAELVDAQSGKSRSRRSRRRKAGSNVGNGKTLHSFRSRRNCVSGYSDSGGALRFFYIAKASKRERADNDHPTVKPLALCEYLAKLILPPEGRTQRRLLVPFSGVASEMIGGLSAGWDYVTGIELDQKHVVSARTRLKKHVSKTDPP